MRDQVLKKQLHLGSERKCSGNYRKTFVLEITNRITRSSIRMQKMRGGKRDRTLSESLKYRSTGQSRQLCLTVKRRMMAENLERLAAGSSGSS
jgi:hypothetical protein